MSLNEMRVVAGGLQSRGLRKSYIQEVLFSGLKQALQQMVQTADFTESRTCWKVGCLFQDEYVITLFAEGADHS